MKVSILTVDNDKSLNLVNIQFISGDSKAYADCLLAHKQELKSLYN
jgi:hypothetical protein